MVCTICGKTIVDPIGTVVDGGQTFCAVCVLRSVKRAILCDDGIMVYINSCNYCVFEEIHHLDKSLVEMTCYLDLDEKSISTSDIRDSGAMIPQWCPLR